MAFRGGEGCLDSAGTDVTAVPAGARKAGQEGCRCLWGRSRGSTAERWSAKGFRQGAALHRSLKAAPVERRAEPQEAAQRCSQDICTGRGRKDWSTGVRPWEVKANEGQGLGGGGRGPESGEKAAQAQGR